MNKFLLGFAYFCIYTTPIQAGFLLWIVWIIFSTDYSILSLSTDEFLTDNLFIIKELVFKYLWPLKSIYQFIWQIPAIIWIVIKAMISTWLGFYLLKIVKKRNIE
tara:strand:+ start:314 stop:628 length:315 start_codon:yes stop_codon:yes gene_type:complete